MCPRYTSCVYGVFEALPSVAAFFEDWPGSARAMSGAKSKSRSGLPMCSPVPPAKVSATSKTASTPATNGEPGTNPGSRSSIDAPTFLFLSPFL